MTPQEFRTIREKLGETQAALAQRLGVSDRAIRRYEAGDREISATIERLLKTLRPRKRQCASPCHMRQD